MTEVGVDSAEHGGESNAASQPAYGGAGQLLRQAREQQHMSVETLASALKVPVYKLQALEADRWDILTDSVFARALALSVCRLLRIPTEPVLAGMPKHEVAKLASNPEGINAPYKEKSLRSLMTSSSDNQSGSTSKVVAGLLVAVAVGAGLYFLPYWEAVDGADAPSVAALTGQSADEPLFMPALQAAPEVPAGDAQQPAEPIAAAEAVAAPPQAAPVEVIVPAVAPPAPEAVAAPVGGRVMRFAATGDSWVQVRDARSKVLMEKVLKAGQVHEATLPAQPLQVVVGNANATQLEIDGAAWDLAASAKNNVARFEVK